MKATLHYKGNQYTLERSKQPQQSSNIIFNEARRITNLKSERIRITYIYENQKIVLNEGTNIPDSVSEFFVKDLGPQFGYRALFIIEYFFPFIIMPVLYLTMNGLSKINAYSLTILLMWTIHFGKRLYETLFVHIFSHATVPISAPIKNCVYYWGFALAISISILRNAESKNSSLCVWHYLFVICFTIFEICNLYCHQTLRALRVNKQGQVTKGHQVPYGIFFDKIACPNYTFEILSWISFSLFARIILPFIFTCVGAIQMYIWAVKKRSMLIKLNPECAKRGTITPFKFL